MYGGNKLEGNWEGNFNILGRKFCFREGRKRIFCFRKMEALLVIAAVLVDRGRLLFWRKY